MKKVFVYVVVVTHDCAYSTSPTVQESEFYGPYTQRQAVALGASLRERFAGQTSNNGGKTVVQVLRLDGRSPEEVLKAYSPAGGVS